MKLVLYKTIQTRLLPALAALLVLMSIAIAQPNDLVKADAIFAEAKGLIAANTVESLKAAIAKLDEAAPIYKAASADRKLKELDLEYGKALRVLGTTEMNAGHDVEALKYFEKGRDKLSPFGTGLELAYAYHNLGFITARLERTADAVANYSKALENYVAVNNKEGQALVLRNLGLIKHNEGKYAEAIRFFESALKLRVVLKDAVNQAILQMDIGDSLRADKKLVEAVFRYKLSLKLYRSVANKKGEADLLYRIGDLQKGQNDLKNAIVNLSAAFKIFEELSDPALATTAEQLGSAQMANGKYADAATSLFFAVELYKVLGEKNNEALTALDLAINYQSLRRLEAAKSAGDRALAAFKEVNNAVGRAYALLVYAGFHSYLNEHEEAMTKINAAKEIFKTNPSPAADYRVAQALSTHYYFLSNYGEAIRYSLAALSFAERDRDDYRMASASIDLANSFSKLGEPQKAIDYTMRAYELSKKLKSRYMESIALSNIGYDHYRQDKLKEAEKFFKRAIAIMHADGFAREEGYATHNLGMLYKKRGDFVKARANYDRALGLYQESGDRRPEAFLYDSMGELYRDLGQYDKAVDSLQKSIVLAREIKYSDVEASALSNMMALWAKRQQPRLAILYGKQAVNVYQSIRAGNSSLDRSTQKSFVRSKDYEYRQLANLLIDAGRLGEAQQVLDLLKEEEYLDFVRRDAAEAVDQAKLALTDNERKALDEYTRLSSQLTALGAKFQTLQDAKSKPGATLTAGEELEYKDLKVQIEEAGVGVRTFLAKLSTEFSKRVEDDATITPASIDALRADLRSVGPDVVLVSTYLLPNRYRVIVTTGRTMVDRKVEYSERNLTEEQINRKISEFQRALQNPRVDPRPLGKELYDIFVQPIENDLRGAGAKTILWSLDGTLRYIPMAALSPDGKTYLAEKYQNVIVTLARQSKLFDAPSGKEWRALGAGVSKPHEGFAALPSVINEINSIVKDAGTTGVLDGKKLIDEKFNLESLRSTLPQTTDDGKSFNVVHLATHFKLGSNDQDSALLMGDGKRLSLFDISKDEDLDFRNIELLALSACETGVAAGDGSGREVESLGMLAQKKGAKAVLATLWKVADEGTSMFMSEFYRLKKADPQMSKAEGIRLTQREMIDGKLTSSGKTGGCRADNFGSGGKSNEFKCDPIAPFSHPYFWSPFILIGNWR